MNKKITCAIILLFIGSAAFFQSCTKAAKSNWKKVFDLPISQGSSKSVIKVQCKTASIGYALLVDGFIRTTNGGLLWVDGSNKFTANYQMSYFDFLTTTKGICIATDFTNTKVFGTTDGGISWILKASSATSPVLSGRIGEKLIMSDSLNGIILTASNEYLSTANGGSSWKYEGKLQFSFSNRPEIALSGTTVSAVDFDNQTYQSTDKGKTWLTKGSVPGSSSTSSIASVDGKTLYAVSNEYSYKSINSGTSWLKLTVEANSRINSVKLFNVSSVALMGTDVDDNTAIWTSTDAGASWAKSIVTTEQTYGYMDFDKISEAGIAIKGTAVYRYIP